MDNSKTIIKPNLKSEIIIFMRMIFYHPAPIKENASSASGIRPKKMLEAFRNIGFDVEEVCGYGNDRKEAIIRVKRLVETGVRYSFAYGENTTLPFLLNEPSHFPSYPFLDYQFWLWLKKQQIPFGCFYRDVYWRFPDFRKGLAFHKWAVPLPFHYLDLFFLKKAKTHFFLPSTRMGKFLYGETDFPSTPLPPGCDVSGKTMRGKNGRKLEVFYVGGVLPPNYDLSPMIEFFRKTNLDITLNLCCRRKEWDVVLERNIYGMIPKQKIRVVHENGEQLVKFWSRASIFLALWGATPYRDFAMPFKILEAVGNSVPIITTKGTAAGDFVEAEGIGWAIPPRSEDLGSLVGAILRNPALLEEKCARIAAIQKNHTWEARADQVYRTLTSGKVKKP